MIKTASANARAYLSLFQRSMARLILTRDVHLNLCTRSELQSVDCMFLACYKFLGKSQPGCSYKVCSYKKACSILNDHGKHLLQICKNFDLRIVNGRIRDNSGP